MRAGMEAAALCRLLVTPMALLLAGFLLNKHSCASNRPTANRRRLHLHNKLLVVRGGPLRARLVPQAAQRQRVRDPAAGPAGRRRQPAAGPWRPWRHHRGQQQQQHNHGGLP